MKTIIFFLLLTFNAVAQNKSHLSLGVEVAPMLHTQEVDNLQKNSLSPNLTISYGSENLSLLASIGVLTRFGFASSNKWVYARGYYTFNTISVEVLEHGAEIELGFNYTFGECENIKLNIGSSIGLLNQGRNSKFTLRPFVLGFSYTIK